jgi:hypothetical protein
MIRLSVVCLLPLLLASAAAAQPAAPSLAGIWVVGEARDCGRRGANAWVLMKDGIYAEVALPQGPINAIGRWRDGGSKLHYTHAHLPLENALKGDPERAMTIEKRTAARLDMTSPSGRKRVFSRCPAMALQAPPGGAAH